jgi:phosphonate utilization transcriptional regulator
MNRPEKVPEALSPLALVQSRSLPMLVQQELEHMILQGELAVGERLNESVLALRFGVSRGPIREALRALEESGLLRLEKNRGVFVREISVAEADEIYDLREALEELIGRRLAKRIGAEQLRELKELLKEMDAATGRRDLDRYHPLNLRFHDLLAEFTGNAKLVATYRRLINELHLFRRRGLELGGGLPVSNGEHRSILRAIESGNAEAAARAMRDHVRASRQRMHKALDK